MKKRLKNKIAKKNAEAKALAPTQAIGHTSRLNTARSKTKSNTHRKNGRG